MPNIYNLCCMQQRISDETNKQEKPSSSPLLGPPLRSVGQRAEGKAALEARLHLQYGGIGAEVAIVMEATVAIIESSIYHSYDGVLWLTNKNEQQLFDRVRDRYLDFRLRSPGNFSALPGDTRKVWKIGRLHKKTNTLDLDRMLRKKHPGLSWVEVMTLWEYQWKKKVYEKLPFDTPTTTVDWAYVFDLAAKNLGFSENDMNFQWNMCTDRAGSWIRGEIHREIDEGKCEDMAMALYRDQQTLRTFLEGPLNKPDHFEMLRRIECLQQQYFQYVRESDYRVRPGLEHWAKQSIDDEWSYFAHRQRQLERAQAKENFLQYIARREAQDEIDIAQRQEQLKKEGKHPGHWRAPPSPV